MKKVPYVFSLSLFVLLGIWGIFPNGEFRWNPSVYGEGTVFDHLSGISSDVTLGKISKVISGFVPGSVVGFVADRPLEEGSERDSLSGGGEENLPEGETVVSDVLDPEPVVSGSGEKAGEESVSSPSTSPGVSKGTSSTRNLNPSGRVILSGNRLPERKESSGGVTTFREKKETPLLESIPGQTEGGEDVGKGDDREELLRFRYWMVPLNEIDRWPWGDFKYYPFPVSRLKKWIADLQAREVWWEEQLHSTGLSQLRLSARLEKDCLVDGKGMARFPAETPSDRPFLFDPCFLSFSSFTWEDGTDASVGTWPDGRIYLFHPKPMGLLFDWSFQGETDAAGRLVFNFSLLSSPATELILTFPEGIIPVSSAGMVKCLGGKSPGTRQWSIHPGGSRQFRVTLTTEGKKPETKGRTGVSNILLYSLSQEGTDLRFRGTLDHGETLPPSITVVLEKPLLPTRLSWKGRSDEVKILSREEEGDQMRITVKVPEFRPEEEMELIVTAFAPPRKEIDFELPRIRLESEEIFWKETGIQLAIRKPLIATDFSVQEGTRVYNPFVQASERQNLYFFRDYSPESRLFVRLSEVRPEFTFSSGSEILFDAEEISFQTDLLVKVNEPGINKIQLKIADLWKIEAVETASEPLLWTMVKDGDGQRLTISLKSPLSTNLPTRIQISGRYLGDVSESVDLPELSPLDLTDVLKGDHLLSLRSESPYKVVFLDSGKNPVSPTTADEGKIREIFSTFPVGTTLALRSDQVGMKVRFDKADPAWTARILGEVSLRSGDVREEWTIHCVPPTGVRVDRVLVAFSPEESGERGEPVPWDWGLVSETGNEMTVTELTDSDQHPLKWLPGMRLWEIRLSTSRSVPFDLRVFRDRKWSDRMNIPLIWLPEINGQTAEVRIDSDGLTTIKPLIRRLTPITAKLPTSGDYETEVGEFRYSPRALVADAGGNRPNLRLGFEKDSDPVTKGWCHYYRLESQYLPDGVIRNHLTCFLENAGMKRIRVRLPDPLTISSVFAVWTDGRRSVWFSDEEDERALYVVLPEKRRFVTVSFEYHQKRIPLSLSPRLYPNYPELEIPILSGDWVVWTPPEFASHHSQKDLFRPFPVFQTIGEAALRSIRTGDLVHWGDVGANLFGVDKKMADARRRVDRFLHLLGEEGTVRRLCQVKKEILESRRGSNDLSSVSQPSSSANSDRLTWGDLFGEPRIISELFPTENGEPPRVLVNRHMTGRSRISPMGEIPFSEAPTPEGRVLDAMEISGVVVFLVRPNVYYVTSVRDRELLKDGLAPIGSDYFWLVKKSTLASQILDSTDPNIVTASEWKEEEGIPLNPWRQTFYSAGFSSMIPGWNLSRIPMESSSAGILVINRYRLAGWRWFFFLLAVLLAWKGPFARPSVILLTVVIIPLLIGLVPPWLGVCFAGAFWGGITALTFHLVRYWTEPEQKQKRPLTETVSDGREEPIVGGDESEPGFVKPDQIPLGDGEGKGMILTPGNASVDLSGKTDVEDSLSNSSPLPERSTTEELSDKAKGNGERGEESKLTKNGEENGTETEMTGKESEMTGEFLSGGEEDRGLIPDNSGMDGERRESSDGESMATGDVEGVREGQNVTDKDRSVNGNDQKVVGNDQDVTERDREMTKEGRDEPDSREGTTSPKERGRIDLSLLVFLTVLFLILGTLLPSILDRWGITSRSPLLSGTAWGEIRENRETQGGRDNGESRENREETRGAEWTNGIGPERGNGNGGERKNVRPSNLDKGNDRSLSEEESQSDLSTNPMETTFPKERETDYYRVFIPYDGEEMRLVDDYAWIPEPFHRKLTEMIQRQENFENPWRLTRALYEGMVNYNNFTRTISLFNLRATYTVEMESSQATLRFPMMPLLPDGGALFDRTPIDPVFVQDRGEILFEIHHAKPGKHLLELTLMTPQFGTSSARGMEIPIPKIPDATLNLTVPVDTPPIHISGALGRVQRQGERLTADLGPTSRIAFALQEEPGKIGQASVEVDQLFLLDPSPTQVILRGEFRLHISGGKIDSLRLKNDPRYLLRQCVCDEAALEPIPPQKDSGSAPSLIQFKRPVSGDVTLRAEFQIKDFSGIGQIKLPRISLNGAKIVRSRLALFESPAVEFDKLPPFELASGLTGMGSYSEEKNGTSSAPPVAVYDLTRTSDDWSAFIHLKQGGESVEERIAWDFGASETTIDYRATLKSMGELFSVRYRTPDLFVPETVEIQDSRGETIRPEILSEPGTLYLFFNRPLRGDYQIHLTGITGSETKKFQTFPALFMDRMPPRPMIVSVYHHRSLWLEFTPPDPWNKIQEEESNPFNDSDNLFLGKWRVPSSETFVETNPNLFLRLNRPQISGRIQSIFYPCQEEKREEEGDEDLSPPRWELMTDFSLDIHNGELDHLDLELDEAFSDSFSLVPEIPHRLERRDNKNILSLLPETPFQGTVKFRFLGKVTQFSESLRLPRLKLLVERGDFSHLHRTIFLPSGNKDRLPESWETENLRKIERNLGKRPEGKGEETDLSLPVEEEGNGNDSFVNGVKDLIVAWDGSSMSPEPDGEEDGESSNNEGFALDQRESDLMNLPETPEKVESRQREGDSLPSDRYFTFGARRHFPAEVTRISGLEKEDFSCYEAVAEDYSASFSSKENKVRVLGVATDFFLRKDGSYYGNSTMDLQLETKKNLVLTLPKNSRILQASADGIPINPVPSEKDGKWRLDFFHQFPNSRVVISFYVPTPFRNRDLRIDGVLFSRQILSTPQIEGTEPIRGYWTILFESDGGNDEELPCHLVQSPPGSFPRIPRLSEEEMSVPSSDDLLTGENGWKRPVSSKDATTILARLNLEKMDYLLTLLSQTLDSAPENGDYQQWFARWLLRWKSCQSDLLSHFTSRDFSLPMTDSQRGAIFRNLIAHGNSSDSSTPRNESSGNDLRNSYLFREANWRNYQDLVGRYESLIDKFGLRKTAETLDASQEESFSPFFLWSFNHEESENRLLFGFTSNALGEIEILKPEMVSSSLSSILIKGGIRLGGILLLVFFFWKKGFRYFLIRHWLGIGVAILGIAFLVFRLGALIWGMGAILLGWGLYSAWRWFVRKRDSKTETKGEVTVPSEDSESYFVIDGKPAGPSGEGTSGGIPSAGEVDEKSDKGTREEPVENEVHSQKEIDGE